jgi:KRAB domain-containing zinc finger protein
MYVQVKLRCSHESALEILQMRFVRLFVSTQVEIEDSHEKAFGDENVQLRHLFKGIQRQEKSEQARKTHIKRFECDVCGQKFALKRILKFHLIFHFNSGAFKCKTCGKRCTSKQGLTMHMQHIHEASSKNLKFDCKICQKQFKTRSAFCLHQLTHQDRKTCEICHKSIAPGHFKNHLKIHELKKEEEKFECKICTRKFFAKSNLTRHLKAYSKTFECDLCGKRFSFKFQLKEHLETHSRRLKTNRAVRRKH